MHVRKCGAVYRNYRSGRCVQRAAKNSGSVCQQYGRWAGSFVVSEAADCRLARIKQAINYGLMKIEVLDRIPITREIR